MGAEDNILNLDSENQFRVSFISNRRTIYLWMVTLYIFIYFLLDHYFRQNNMITFILSFGIFLLFTILIANLANKILSSKLGKYEITYQLIFEVILIVSSITNKILTFISDLYEGFRKLTLVCFFLISYLFLSLNWLNLVDWLIYFHQWNYLLAYSHLLTNIIAWSYFLYFYVFVVLVILLQWWWYIWKIWQRYAGYIFLWLLWLFFMMPFIMQSWLKGFFWSYYTSLALMISLIISEFFWLAKITNKRLPENWISITKYMKNYTVQSLNWAQTSNIQEIVKIYLRWKNNISNNPRFLVNKIPYLLDTPITHSLEDKLKLREIAEKIFQYITNIELQGNVNSVVIWVDWPRWSGKTSIINILKNDYLGYVRDHILTFEFRAWSYSKGNIIEGFLNDFATFCNANNIYVEKEIKQYINSLECIHRSFWVLNLFAWQTKTNSERIFSISSAIRRSKKKIVIIIDDIDRISNSDDINDLLRLLRSTANFYWIFYVLNYSKDELLSSKNKDLILALKDFEEKFLNWKIEVPPMEIIWYWQSEKAELLTSMISEELTIRGWYMIEILLKGLSDNIDEKLNHIIDITNNAEWQQQSCKEAFIEMLGQAKNSIPSYFERSVSFCVQSLVNPQYNTDLLMGNTPDRLHVLNAVKTPRKAKIVINEALRLLSLDNIFIDDYFRDLETYMYRESHDPSECDWPLRNSISLLTITTPTSFWKRLKEVLDKQEIILE